MYSSCSSWERTRSGSELASRLGFDSNRETDDVGRASPRLKDAVIPEERLRDLYLEMLVILRTIFIRCRLVHADFSEYNVLFVPPLLLLFPTPDGLSTQVPRSPFMGHRRLAISRTRPSLRVRFPPFRHQERRRLLRPPWSRHSRTHAHVCLHYESLAEWSQRRDG